MVATRRRRRRWGRAEGLVLTATPALPPLFGADIV
jgi:hypothetical protein